MSLLIKLRFSSLRHRWPWMILAILFKPFGFIAPKTLNYLGSNLSMLSIPDGGYSRNASCALNLISTFYLLILRDGNVWSKTNFILIFRRYQISEICYGSLAINSLPQQFSTPTVTNEDIVCHMVIYISLTINIREFWERWTVYKCV